MSETPSAPADSHDRLDLIVNGATTSAAARTLAALLDEQGYGDRKVATALNGAFVPAAARTATRLKSGDRVEIVAARQGG